MFSDESTIEIVKPYRHFKVIHKQDKELFDSIIQTTF